MLVPLLLAVAAINLSRIPGLAGYPGPDGLSAEYCCLQR